MSFISIFNDILGPVMRGPSSSHTAGSYNIAKIIRAMLSDRIFSAKFIFDINGSYAPTYKILGVDKAFAMGLLGLDLMSEQFHIALQNCKKEGLGLEFTIGSISGENHPNTVLIDLVTKSNYKLVIIAESIGGGSINIKKINNWPVSINGLKHELFVESDKDKLDKIIDLMSSEKYISLQKQQNQNRVLLHFILNKNVSSTLLKKIRSLDKKIQIWPIKPVFLVQGGKEIFSNSNEMVKAAKTLNYSLGKIGLKYESTVLGFPKTKVINEMTNRLNIMLQSVEKGLDEKNISMYLTKPSANKILEFEKRGKLAIGGIHTRAAARAMATMHVDNSMGIVCAAPTGGSAGVLPGIITTLLEEKQIGKKMAVEILFAASAIGLIIAKRATFSAELAGCQVEIGAASAMAAAAIIEYAGGNAQQATDAAAIALQNTMGSVCDPVQGGCEIPCHTRNAMATSNAFICADLILGGYNNPIPLDETIDAMYDVGKAMPKELRCTAKGGIAITPSALALKPLK
ncbi:MAG: L-serine ammonia-lyase, iron-sulfur-dependent, subunit alpha [Candidatus Neomarinimicrobiota bacterium]